MRTYICDHCGEGLPCLLHCDPEFGKPVVCPHSPTDKSLWRQYE